MTTTNRRNNYIFEFNVSNERFEDILEEIESKKTPNDFIEECVDVFNKLRKNF